MKILGISCGTKNGNNDAMCREALMGAKEKGAEIDFINLFDLDLKPCTGCIACVGNLMQGKDGGCVIRDDYYWLRDRLLDADGIVFAIPIFEKGVPAIFKILQDRFAGPSQDRGMVRISKMISGKTGNAGPDPRIDRDKFVSFISIGGSDWTTRISSDVKTFCMSPMWTIIDEHAFQWSKSIAVDDEKVDTCHNVGVNLVNAVNNPEEAKYLGDKGVCSHCHSRNFYIDKDQKAICTVCGIIGDLKVTDDKYSFDFPEEQLEHAHDTISGKMIHANDIKENEGKLREDKQTDKYKERMAKYKEFIQGSKPSK
ncbi:MAG: flavodoxin family protein [Lachnospirales bacterium]